MTGCAAGQTRLALDTSGPLGGGVDAHQVGAVNAADRAEGNDVPLSLGTIGACENSAGLAPVSGGGRTAWLA
jgi:hypothetical protein